MKQKITIFTIFFFTVISAFGGKDSELKKYVREVQKECPVILSENVSMDKVKYKNNTVTLLFKISDEVMDFNAIHANEQTFKNNMLIGFANNQSDFFKKFFNAIIDADANLDIIFKTPSGENLFLHFKTDELKVYRPDENANPETMVKINYENSKLQIPKDFGNGIVLTDVILDDQYYTYVYECDESMIEIDSLKTPMVKSFLSLEIANDKTLLYLYSLLQLTNRGLAFKYIGKTSGKSETISFKFNSEEEVGTEEVIEDVIEDAIKIKVPEEEIIKTKN